MSEENSDDNSGGNSGDSGDADTGNNSGSQNNGQVDAAPEWMNEKHHGDYYDDKTGKINSRKMYDSLVSATKKNAYRDTDLRNIIEPEVRSKIEAERLTTRPEKIEDYKVEFPDNFFPEGMTFETEEGNPLLGFWKEQCFENGFTNEQYQKGVQQYVDGLIQSLPDTEAVAKELGENGHDRIDAATYWLKRNLNSDEFVALSELVETKVGVEAVEKLINLKSDPKINTMTQSIRNSAPITEKELQNLVSSEAYQDSTHADHMKVREQVDIGYQRLYPPPG